MTLYLQALLLGFHIFNCILQQSPLQTYTIMAIQPRTYTHIQWQTHFPFALSLYLRTCLHFVCVRERENERVTEQKLQETHAHLIILESEQAQLFINGKLYISSNKHNGLNVNKKFPVLFYVLQRSLNKDAPLVPLGEELISPEQEVSSAYHCLQNINH